MTNKVRVINWFLMLTRDMLVNPTKQKNRPVTDYDVACWSEFETRMREVCDLIGARYIPHDITMKGKNGRYVFSTSGFFLWMGANSAVFSRVPELRAAIDAWRVVEETARLRNKAHPARFASTQAYIDRLDGIAARSYRQLEAVFAEDKFRGMMSS